MKKKILLEENHGAGLYIFKLNKELFELKGNTPSERIRFAVKEFLNFPERKQTASKEVLHRLSRKK